MQHFDIIIVGLGAMGASAAMELAARKIKVLGLEQFDIPHALGSSTGFSRMIRLAYYEHPDYVPLLRRAYKRWTVLEAKTQQKLLYLTGGLYIGPRDGGLITGSLQAARLHHLDHELLDAGQMADRYPQFNLPAEWVTMHEPMAGFLLPEKVIAAFADQALRSGAELHGREAVVDWKSDSGGVIVRTARAEYRAAKVIFCGGAWSGKLLKHIGVELHVTRQVMAWVWPKTPGDFALGKLPVWAIDNPDGSLDYGFPMMPENPGFKIAHHGPATQTDPDRVIRDMLPGDEETFRPALRQFLPSADGPLLSLRTCLYTNSPDQHFIVDRHPADDRIIIACGFSGHGFKFASVIGEVLADLAERGTTQLPAGFLGLGRFAKPTNS
ncbi:MAG TPA: N-methyl-L-tryptophan oxidase [Tepidisphaeraceae bacterium]|jgi:sarcosine oxidase|nr:N-methyl-L-tryptophan oxidase [Tepidisphaeraceae bacterium]